MPTGLRDGERFSPESMYAFITQNGNFYFHFRISWAEIFAMMRIRMQSPISLTGENGAADCRLFDVDDAYAIGAQITA